MNFLNNIAMKIATFMQGRRGIDELGIVIFVIGIVLTLISSLANIAWLSILGWAAYIYVIWRALSKDINKRALENEAFQRKSKSAKRKKDLEKKKWTNRKTTGYVTCSKCGTNLSYPKGKGKLRLTCPKCRNVFEVDSGKPKKK